MNHRSVIRVSSLFLGLLVLGCTTEEPTSIPASERLEISPLFVGLDPGMTQQVVATVGGVPVDATWESSNPAVATVSATGLVSAVSDGFSAVTAKLVSDPSKLISSNITVNKLLGIALTNGVAVGPLASSGARNSSVLYRLFVPTGKTNVTFTLSGGTGDPDIYVRRGTPPTASASGSTCRSENDVGVTETCSIANPATGTWYILINLFVPYDGWTLKGTYIP